MTTPLAVRSNVRFLQRDALREGPRGRISRHRRPPPDAPTVSSSSTSRTFRKQRIRRERFLEERDARVEHAVVHDRVVGVARHEKHLLISGTQRGRDAIGQLRPAHPRHHHVRHEQVNLRGILFAHEERLAAVLRLEHIVATAPRIVPRATTERTCSSSSTRRIVSEPRKVEDNGRLCASAESSSTASSRAEDRS